jgi:hypothetical protein
MANAHPQNKGSHLLVSRKEAETLVSRQVAEGRELLRTPINTEGELRDAERRESRWLDYNIELFRRIFSTDSYAQRYETHEARVYGNLSFSEEVHYYRERVEGVLNQLESDVRKLSIVPESPAHPTSGKSSAMGKSSRLWNQPQVWVAVIGAVAAIVVGYLQFRPQREDHTIAISGRIVDERGKAVKGAKVTLEQPSRSPQRRFTDSEGAFRFEKIATVQTRLQAEASGREQYVLDINPSDNVFQEIHLNTEKIGSAPPPDAKDLARVNSFLGSWIYKKNETDEWADGPCKVSQVSINSKGKLKLNGPNANDLTVNGQYVYEYSGQVIHDGTPLHNCVWSQTNRRDYHYKAYRGVAIRCKDLNKCVMQLDWTSCSGDCDEAKREPISYAMEIPEASRTADSFAAINGGQSFVFRRTKSH